MKLWSHNHHTIILQNHHMHITGGHTCFTDKLICAITVTFFQIVFSLCVFFSFSFLVFFLLFVFDSSFIQIRTLIFVNDKKVSQVKSNILYVHTWVVQSYRSLPMAYQRPKIFFGLSAARPISGLHIVLMITIGLSAARPISGLHIIITTQ